jgi:hypothetical protein
MNFKTIDLYWVHSWDTLTPIEEVMHTLNAAVERDNPLHRPQRLPSEDSLGIFATPGRSPARVWSPGSAKDVPGPKRRGSVPWFPDGREKRGKNAHGF